MQLIKRVVPIAALCIIVSACTSAVDTVNFKSMTAEELIAYNRGKPVLQQVYCQNEVATGSHIRKMRCETVSDWVYALPDNYSTLGVLSTGPMIFR